MNRLPILRTARILSTGLFASALAMGCIAGTDSNEDLDQSKSAVDPSGVDMAEWVIPSCDSAGAAWQVGSEQFRVVPMGMKGNMGRFVIVKSSNGDGYEEWAVDSEYLRIRSDTTWAYQPYAGGPWCDVKCGDNGANNCQQRWNTNSSDPLNGLQPSSPWAYTLYQAPGQSGVAAPWIKRHLKLPMGGSTEFTTQMEIKGADRNGCSECWVNFGTKPGESVSRTVRARRYEKWNGFADVVHLSVLSGPGAGEQYYYGRDVGWIGFNGTVASHSVSSQTMPTSSCAGFQQGSICAATGGSAAPPPNDPPPPPPPPPPSGSCECKSGVDNYCLYGANVPNCAMTEPGGYCDPDGNGDFGDADWVRGYNEYHDNCPGGSPPPPPPPPPASCECRSDVDNYCLYGANYPNCAMTAPGGYCDPNGNGDFGDADWVRGYNEYHDNCK